MKMLILLALLVLVFAGCMSFDSPAVPTFSGSWSSMGGTGQYSIITLSESGRVTLYSKIGSAYARSWEGWWRQEKGRIMFFDAGGRPYTVGTVTEIGEFYVFFFNEVYTFHRYGTERK